MRKLGRTSSDALELLLATVCSMFDEWPIGQWLVEETLDAIHLEHRI